MRLIVADAGPLRYLFEIGHIDVLHVLFDTIFIPSVVANELMHPSTPRELSQWMSVPPFWLKISSIEFPEDPDLKGLDKGEISAIALGLSLRADMILIDDRKAVSAAMKKGFDVTGTLGILVLASRRNYLDLTLAIKKLRATNFHYRPEILDAVLAQHQKSGND